MLVDILIGVGAALFVGLMIVRSILNKKKGKSSCGCDCSSCSGSCAYREKLKEKQDQ